MSRRADAAVALALALVAALVVAAHVRNFQHAGALERDECNSAAFAAMPSLRAAWSSLRYDSVPFASTLLFRGWTRLGLGSDAGLRALGLLVGCAVIAALAWHARLHGAPYPAASLLLLALHPNAIRFGDAVRPTGLGLLVLVLAAALLWRALRRPGPASVALAAAAAVLAVHTLYQNAALLAGPCLAGAVVALRRRRPMRAALSLGIGAVAALSLLVYLPTLRAARAWLPLVQSPPDQSGIWLAIASPRPWNAWLWIGGLAAGLAVAVGRQVARARRAPADREADAFGGGDAALFAGATLVAGTLAYVGFIAALRVTARPWYYLPLMALATLCLDALLGPLLRRDPARWIAGLALAGISALHLAWGTGVLEVRQTNLDVVADSLAAEAGPRDFVIVNPWYCGVTLHRYARGRTRWVTVPPLEDLSIHRFDLLKRRMESTGVMDSVLARVAATLAAGDRVWLVGYLPPPRAGASGPPPPAPALGWNVEAYATAWGTQVSALIAAHALGGHEVAVAPGGEVSPAENMSLRALEGWH